MRLVVVYIKQIKTEDILQNVDNSGYLGIRWWDKVIVIFLKFLFV